MLSSLKQKTKEASLVKSARYVVLVAVIFFSLMSGATSTPKTFTYQGRLMNAAGTAPLTGNLTLVVELYEDEATPDCLMYSERHSITTADGLFSIIIGSGTRNTAYLTFNDDPSWDMKYIFDNSHSFTNANCPLQTPAANAQRKLRMHVYDGSTWTQLGDQTLTAVPQAIVAETLQGREAIEFAQVWTTAARPAAPVAGQTGFNTTTNRIEYWTGAAWEQKTPAFSATTKDGTATDNDVMRWNDTNNEWEPTSVGTLLGTAQDDLTGTWPNITVVGLDGNTVTTGALAGGDAGKVLKWDGTKWVADTDNGGIGLYGTQTHQYHAKFYNDAGTMKLTNSILSDNGTTLYGYGDIVLNQDATDRNIDGLATPTTDKQAANKKYVDDALAAAANVDDGTVTGQTLVWNGTTWVPTSDLFVDETGNRVGINNTAPGNFLNVNTPTTAHALADAMIGTSATTQKGLVIQGRAGQTANLQEWQTSTGTTALSISSDGSSLTRITSGGVLLGAGTASAGNNIPVTIKADGGGYPILLQNAGTTSAAINSTRITLDSGIALGWTSGAVGFVNPLDVGFSRLSPGVVAVGTGATGSTAGTLVATNVSVGTSTPNERLTINGVLSLAETTAPTLSAGYGKIYVKADNGVYYMDEAGTESQFAFASASGETNTASNRGAAAADNEGVFHQKSGVDLEFKRLKEGTGITLSSDNDYITIAAAGLTAGAAAGEYLVWDNTNSTWEPALVTAGSDTSSSYDEAGNLTITVTKIRGKAIDSDVLPTVNGQIYFWDNDNSEWRVTDPTALVEGNFMRWDDTAKEWEPAVGVTVDATGYITLPGAPTANDHAATKAYVDTAVGAVEVAEIVDADGDTKIQVEESADEDKIRFDTAGSERVIIDETGKVGIGTTSPGSKLDVVGGNISVGDFSASTAKIMIKGGAGQATNLFEVYLQSNQVTPVTTIDSSGGFHAAFNTANLAYMSHSFQGGMSITSNFSGTTPLYAKGAAGQTADVFQVRNSADTSLFKVTGSGGVAIGVATPTTGTILDITGTGAAGSSIIIPRDTTANRPTVGVNGMMRYNSTTDKFEAYENGAWANVIASGGTISGLTTNTIPKATSATAIGDSNISDNGTTISTAAAKHVNMDSNTFYLDSTNDRVGIGTAVPGARLDVSSAAGGVGSGIRLIQAAENGSANASYVPIDFTVPTSGLIGQFLATANNYSNAAMNLPSNSIGLFAESASGSLVLAAAGASGDVRIGTGGYATANERMRITSSGNVGIGTGSPGYQLDVQGTANGWTKGVINLRNTNAGTGAASGVVIGNDGNADVAEIWVGSAASTYTLAQNRLVLQADTSGAGVSILAEKATGDIRMYTGGTTERARVTSDGALYMTGIATGSAPAVSAADTGTIYYNSTDDKFKVSLSTGAYVNLATTTGSSGAVVDGSGTANTIAKFSDSDTLADSALTDNATTLAYTGTGGLNLSTTYPRIYANGTLFMHEYGSKNTFLGENAGNTTLTGSVNTAVGEASSVALTTGSYNIAMGSDSLNRNSTGSGNVALGTGAMYGGASPYTGSDYNTAVGYYALAQISSSADYNVAIGSSALNASTTGYNNTAVGYRAIASGTDNFSNTAIGYEALDALTTGDNNTAVGSGALGAATTGYSNVAVGNGALSSNQTGHSNMVLGGYNGSGSPSRTVAIGNGIGYIGSDNVVSGFGALNSSVSGATISGNIVSGNFAMALAAVNGTETISNNVILGPSSGYGAGWGADFTYNVVIGASAGYGDTGDGWGGSSNVIIGYNSGVSLDGTSSSNVLIGTGAGPGSTSTVSNKLYINNSSSDTPLIWGDFANGRLGIKRQATTYALEVSGEAGKTSGTGSWQVISDARLKDITGKYERGLEEILKLNTVRFYYKKGNELGMDSENEKIGVIAQQLMSVIPEAVNQRQDGYFDINADPIHWATINAIQELNNKCEMSKEQIADLDSRLKNTERKVANIEKDLRLQSLI